MLTDDGVYTCGDGDFGRLGLGHDDVALEPTKVEALVGINIVPRARKLRERKELMRRGSNWSGGNSTRGLDVVTPPRNESSPRMFGQEMPARTASKATQQAEALKDVTGKLQAVSGAATALFKRGKLGSM